MEVIILICVLVKILQQLTGSVNCQQQQQQQQQQPSSTYVRVLKNKHFQHSCFTRYDEVVHFTKCLAICNLKQQCGSVNYHAGLRTCISYHDVTEEMKVNEENMLDADGWMYYEKEKQSMVRNGRLFNQGLILEYLRYTLIL